MFTDMHYFTDKLLFRMLPWARHILEKLAVLFIPLSLFMLFSGTTGIIEQQSPDALATLSSMGSSFFNSFGLHSLILAGAFGITFIVWVFTRNIWDQPDNEPKDCDPESARLSALANDNSHHSRDTSIIDTSDQSTVLK